MTDNSTPTFDPHNQWAFGFDTFGNDELPDHLLKISVHHAHWAITKSRSNEPLTLLESAIHAGSAVELFAKYHLSQINPVLIVDMKGIQNHGLLHVLGERIGPAPADQKKRKVLTRGPMQCLELIMLMSGQELSKDDLNKVLDVRNSAVHMGLVDGPELQQAIIAMASLLDALIEISDVPRSKYWGSQIALINKLSSREELHNAVKARLDAAREVAKSLDRIDESTLIYALHENSRDGRLFDLEEYPTGTSYWYSQTCPGCKRVGKVFCTVWITEPSNEYDGDAFVEETAKGLAYRCDWCRLELNEREMYELRLGATRSIAYRAATEAELTSYQEHMAGD